MPPAALQSKRPIVISGPSGAGKSTLLKRLFAEYPDTFEFSVSHTTRAPRRGEQDGTDYHFVTRGAFQDLLRRGGFVEHAQFGGNFYGTSVAALADIAAKGKIGILDIEMEGVKQVKQTDLHPRFLFLAPPSLEVLERRLRARQTDDEEAVGKRLAQARREMEFAGQEGVHDRIVVNEDLERAYEEMRGWMLEGAGEGEGKAGALGGGKDGGRGIRE